MGKVPRGDEDGNKPMADAFLWESWFPWPLAVNGRLGGSIFGQYKEGNLFLTAIIFPPLYVGCHHCNLSCFQLWWIGNLKT